MLHFLTAFSLQIIVVVLSFAMKTWNEHAKWKWEMKQWNENVKWDRVCMLEWYTSVCMLEWYTCCRSEESIAPPQTCRPGGIISFHFFISNDGGCTSFFFLVVNVRRSVLLPRKLPRKLARQGGIISFQIFIANDRGLCCFIFCENVRGGSVLLPRKLARLGGIKSFAS